MITTKETNKKMTPEERKQKVKDLSKEHEKYFNSIDMSNSVYIPKMAYRPSGKDELHISFFPSELEKGKNVYTEFVSIDYESEDPKRSLYLWKHNEHWTEEYELIESSSGFQRHIIPVGELKVINDVNSRNANKKEVKDILDFKNLPDPDEVTKEGQEWLQRIAIALENIAETLNKKK